MPVYYWSLQPIGRSTISRYELDRVLDILDLCQWHQYIVCYAFHFFFSVPLLERHFWHSSSLQLYSFQTLDCSDPVQTWWPKFYFSPPFFISVFPSVLHAHVNSRQYRLSSSYNLFWLYSLLLLFLALAVPCSAVPWSYYSLCSYLFLLRL